MINGNIITNKGISIGRNSETLLNVLLGFNSPDTQNEEYYKLDCTETTRVKNCKYRTLKTA